MSSCWQRGKQWSSHVSLELPIWQSARLSTPLADIHQRPFAARQDCGERETPALETPPGGVFFRQPAGPLDKTGIIGDSDLFKLDQHAGAGQVA